MEGDTSLGVDGDESKVGYEEVRAPSLRKLKSTVWSSFKKFKKPGGEIVAVCNYCGQNMVGNSGTTHLKNHLKRKHGEFVANSGSDVPQGIPKSKVRKFDQERRLEDHATMTLKHDNPPSIELDGESDVPTVGFCEVKPVASYEAPTSNLRDNTIKGMKIGTTSKGISGRVISVKLGDRTAKIGIDGSSEDIERAIKSFFSLRGKRAFWLQDEDEVVRPICRDMPLGDYTLHLDGGLRTIICLSGDPSQEISTIVESFYTDDDFTAFLQGHGWAGLKSLRSNRTIYSVVNLDPDELYQGVRLLNDS